MWKTQCFFSDTLVAILRVHDLRKLPPLDFAKKTVVTGRRVTDSQKHDGKPRNVSALERAKSLFSIPPIISVAETGLSSPFSFRIYVSGLTPFCCQFFSAHVEFSQKHCWEDNTAELHCYGIKVIVHPIICIISCLSFLIFFRITRTWIGACHEFHASCYLSL